MGLGEDDLNPVETTKKHPTEDDSDQQKPLIERTEDHEINVAEYSDLLFWANEFNISIEELKMVILMNGNSVRKIKKYLSL